MISNFIIFFFGYMNKNFWDDNRKGGKKWVTKAARRIRIRVRNRKKENRNKRQKRS